MEPTVPRLALLGAALLFAAFDSVAAQGATTGRAAH